MKRKTELTADRLREVLAYDPQTGVFTWKTKTNRRIRVGKVAGSLRSDGYIGITIDNRRYLAHRLATLWMTGEWPASEVDHRHSRRSDNRWSRIRLADHAQNMQNRPIQRNNTSGVKGVTWDAANGKWMATVCAGGRKIHCGRFADIADAE